jgi:site-specific DNA-methyltransferase (adenine-specific)
MPYMEKSKTDSHGTPDYILERVKKDYGELNDFDPCPLNDNPTFNGLDIEYPRDKIIFINPPYSSLKTTKKKIGWVEKAHNECMKGSEIVMLIPARTDTQWFHDFILGQYNVEFIRGRIKFKGSKTGAPFPSMLVHFKL